MNDRITDPLEPVINNASDVNQNFKPIWDPVNIKRDKMQIRENVLVFRSWCQQSEALFRFIPLTLLLGEPGKGE